MEKETSTKVISYFPQSVLLPYGIRRELQLDKNHLHGGKLDEEEKVPYDHKTLFYDMFLSSDKRHLICIGPPFVNLGSPHSIRCQDRNLSFFVKFDYGYGAILNLVVYIAVSRLTPADIWTFYFRFSSFDLTVSYRVRRINPAKGAEVILTTRQKDNPIVWIQDWCRWHKRVHGIQRVILYDNSSQNLTALRHSLSRLDEDMEIILIHWPFPFGLVFSCYNEYCHAGSLNHCRLAFCYKTHWYLNIDIDEYIYVKGNQSITNYLKPKKSPVIYLAFHKVPAGKRNLGSQRLPRFYDYTESSAEMFYGAVKYVCRPQHIRTNFVHHSTLKWYPKIMTAVGRIIRNRWRAIMATAMTKRAGKTDQNIYNLYRLNLKLAMGGVGKTSQDIWFYHFGGLNTLWKKDNPLWRKYRPPSTSALDTVSDTRVRNLAIEKDILKKPGRSL